MCPGGAAGPCTESGLLSLCLRAGWGSICLQLLCRASSDGGSWEAMSYPGHTCRDSGAKRGEPRNVKCACRPFHTPEVAKPSSCSFLDGSFGTGHPAAPGGCVMASDCLQLLGSW